MIGCAGVYVRIFDRLRNSVPIFEIGYFHKYEDGVRASKCVNAMAGIEDPEEFMENMVEVKEYLEVIIMEPIEPANHRRHGKDDRLMATKALALFPTPNDEDQS